MIQANELRIGNWIIPNNGTINIFRVDSLVYEDGRYIAEMYIDFPSKNQIMSLFLKDSKSIPLTEEILLMCGFEKSSQDGEVYFIWGDCFHLHQFNQYGHFAYKCGDNLEGNFVSTRIDSLHQLQNLYFSLTGKELEMRKNAKEVEKQLTGLHVFGADRNLPKSTDVHNRNDNQQKQQY